MFSSCVILILASIISVNAETESKIVNTLQGPVRGYKSAEWDLYEFYGIPYATAPKGEDKFKAPMPPPEWTDPFDAVSKNIICPQNKTGMVKNYGFSADFNENENCLVANIFVSNTDDYNKPVLVYVHGGGYQWGSGTNLQPKTLVEDGNIVAVTFNYRLSVEGFLCLGTEKIPGNAGLKDMVALLRWIQNNIAPFGGNPNDVTLAGYSAGSTAVDLLMLSDLTSGLFHKAIYESGTAASLWAVQQDPLENAQKFAKSLNFDSSNIDDLEKFFTTASYEMLTAFTFLTEKDSSTQFVPCIELDIGQERVLKDYPLNILKTGMFKKIPTLLGFASEEGYVRAEMYKRWNNEMNKNFAEFLPADILIPNEVQKLKVAKEIKEFYFGKEPIHEITEDGYLKYFGDIFTNYASIKTVMKLAEAKNENVYFYVYSFFDDTILLPYMLSNESLPVRGAYHCAQSHAVCDEVEDRGSSYESKDYKEIRGLMRTIWKNFIKTGKPISDGSLLIPEGWPPAQADATPYMVLDKIPQLSYKLTKEYIKFWDEIYAKYYRIPIPPAS